VTGIISVAVSPPDDDSALLCVLDAAPATVAAEATGRPQLPQ